MRLSTLPSSILNLVAFCTFLTFVIESLLGMHDIQAAAEELSTKDGLRFARSSCQTIGEDCPQLKDSVVLKLARKTAPDDLHFSGLVRRFIASSGHGLPL